MKYFLLALGIFVAGGSLLADPRFRADDGNLWRLDDNPALAAASGDGFAAGTAYTPDVPTYTHGTHDVQLISPLVSFRYVWKDTDSVLKVGSAVGPWAGLSLGYRADSVRHGSDKTMVHNFGVLYRPVDLLSAAVTVDDTFATDRRWGAGFGVRPLTLGWPGADWLTLTADARWSSSDFAVERYGARLSWQGSDVRVWYDTVDRAPGVEVTASWGPWETTVSPTTVGTALRWSSRTPDPAAFGPVILKIEAPGPLASAPLPEQPLTRFVLGGHRSWDLPRLISLLHRAADVPNVVAVAFVDPPEVSGLAGAQELALALERLQKAGKKVYIHADSFDDSVGYQAWESGADRVSLDPAGAVGLVSGGSRRLYLKGLFDSVGIQFYNFAPWETKSVNNFLTFAAMPDGERAMVTRYLGDRDGQAAAALAHARGPKLKADATQLAAQGPYLTGRSALAAGLVDTLETRIDFLDWLSTAVPGAAVTDSVPQLRSQAWGPTVTRRNVALVYLSGDIVPGGGERGRSIGRAAVDTLASLRNDLSIEAVVLRVDSPGGSVLPSAALADQVRKTVAAGKPVLVVMGDVAASGGYYLSAPATRIWARPGTLTGSIGVTAALFTAPQALEKLGIHADGVDLGPSAAFDDWTRAPTADTLARWRSMIDETYQTFLDVVAAGRHLDRTKVDALARGQVYTGREALSLGLVDELGGLTEAEAWLVKKLGGPVEWKEYLPGAEAPFGGLLGPLATAAADASSSPTLRLAAGLDRWFGPAAEALNAAAARGPGAQVWFPGL